VGKTRRVPPFLTDTATINGTQAQTGLLHRTPKRVVRFDEVSKPNCATDDGEISTQGLNGKILFPALSLRALCVLCGFSPVEETAKAAKVAKRRIGHAASREPCAESFRTGELLPCPLWLNSGSLCRSSVILRGVRRRLRGFRHVCRSRSGRAASLWPRRCKMTNRARRRRRSHARGVR